MGFVEEKAALQTDLPVLNRRERRLLLSNRGREGPGREGPGLGPGRRGCGDVPGWGPTACPEGRGKEGVVTAKDTISVI